MRKAVSRKAVSKKTVSKKPAKTTAKDLTPLIEQVAGWGTEFPRGSKPPKDKASSFWTVAKEGPRLRELLSDDAADVRVIAAFLLAWFPQQAKDSLKALKARLAKERDERAAASLALAVGALGSKADAAALQTHAKGKGLAAEAASIALAHLAPSATLTPTLLLAAKRDKPVKLPWAGGDLQDFAADALLLVPGDAAGQALEKAALKGSESAALQLIALVFPKPAGKKLTPAQQGAIAAVLDGAGMTSEIVGRLEKRGLPGSFSELSKLLGRQPPTKETALSALVTFDGTADTVLAHLKKAVKKKDDTWRRLADAVATTLPVDAAVGAALDAEELLALKGWGTESRNSDAFALAVLKQVAPQAKGALATAEKRLKKDGPGKRDNPFGGQMDCQTWFLWAIGTAFAAMAGNASLDAKVKKHLLITAWDENVCAALALYPADERDAWLLRRGLDSESQPSDGFPGAWPYWEKWPSAKITARVLQHVAKWEADDKERKANAKKYLKRYAEALRASGQVADAARCEALLAA